jgi:hypothetical protein
MPATANWKYFNAVLHGEMLALAPASTSVNKNTTLLNSAYTHNSGGAAFGAPFCPLSSGNLTDFWCKVDAYTGTWASTDQLIKCEIREGLLGNNRLGSTTLVGSFNIDLTGAPTGWVAVTGLSLALTAGKFYSIIIGDPDGNGTNFVTMVNSLGGTPINPSFVGGATPRTTTDGFSTAGTSLSSRLAVTFRYDGQLYSMGGAFDTRATNTSGTYQRGVKFTMDENAILIGALNIAFEGFYNNTIINRFRLYEGGSTLPGGTPILDLTIPLTTINSATTPIPSAQFFGTANYLELKKGQTYRLTLAPSSGATLPRRITITGSPPAEVLAANLPRGGCWTDNLANSAAWTDDTASWSDMGPLLVPRRSPTVVG